MQTKPPFMTACVEWATEQAPQLNDIPHLLDSYCRFLRGQGVSVRRCNLKTDTVHPQMWAIRYVWYSERAEPGFVNPAVIVRRRQYEIEDAFIDEVFFRAGAHDTPQYRASPFYRIEQEGELVASIAPPGETQAYPVFDDLAALGCTAYFGTMLGGFGSAHKLVSVAVDNARGLSEAALVNLRTSARLLTLHLSTLLEHEIKNTIARTYIGRDPGERVCSGMIELGQVSEIEGAIWFSDIRGFTQMSETLAPVDLVASLNRYYDNVVGAIYAHDGEVLKFIGDAVLAVFPARSFTSPAHACAAALEAAAAKEATRGGEALSDGVALHYGVAQYGNIGASDRLDFTLIGKEVNLASRAKDLNSRAGASVVCTRAFKDAAGAPMRALGVFEAKGLNDPIELFAP